MKEWNELPEWNINSFNNFKRNYWIDLTCNNFLLTKSAVVTSRVRLLRRECGRYEIAVVTRVRSLRECGCYESAVVMRVRALRKCGRYVESAVVTSRVRLLRKCGRYESTVVV